MGAATAAGVEDRMSSSFAHDAGELKKAQRLDMLHQEVLAGHPPVFEQTCSCFTVPSDRVFIWRFSNPWQATFKFKFKNRADAVGPFFLGWSYRELYAVPTEELRR